MILDEIVENKRIEIERSKAAVPLSRLKDAVAAAAPPRDFAGALRGEDIRLIAEVKKASPSAGLIRADFDPVAIARAYERAGAAAISVLTDARYFQGRLDYLTQIHDAVSLPVLRKDFIVDAYQLYEARAAGADAVLLIVRVLPGALLASLLEQTRELGMAALVESHSEDELQTAIHVGAQIVGINNRDLDQLEIDLAMTERLIRHVPGDRIVVSESGIRTAADVDRLRTWGVAAMLVGETLMRAGDMERQVRDLLG